eukprot:scaffold60947_cov48-Phaeocystis_antarctica.AAC.3
MLPLPSSSLPPSISSRSPILFCRFSRCYYVVCVGAVGLFNKLCKEKHPFFRDLERGCPAHTVTRHARQPVSTHTIPTRRHDTRGYNILPCYHFITPVLSPWLQPGG